MLGGGGEVRMHRAGARARVSRSRSPSGSFEVSSLSRTGEVAVAEEGYFCSACVEYRRLVASSSDPPRAASIGGGGNGAAGSSEDKVSPVRQVRTESGDSKKSSSATSRQASMDSKKSSSTSSRTASMDSKSSPARRRSSGSSSSHGESENSSFQSWFGQSSVSSVPDGTEDSSWGGVDVDSVFQCSHGKPPRRLFCWEGKNTGRRFLGCHLKDKSKRRGFVQWLDGEWHPRAQKVMTTLWGMIRYYINVADKNQVDYMAECAMRNETVEENQTLMEEKEDWEREKQSLLMERERMRNDNQDVHMRWRFAQGLCQAMQMNVRNEVKEKKRIWLVVISLVGCLVAFIFGVVIKLK